MTNGQVSFLSPAAPSADGQRLLDDDLEHVGYVMNVSRLWAHEPATYDALFALIGDTARTASLTFRQRGILIVACASTMGDAYCSLAWGGKLAAEAGSDVVLGVLRGDDTGLDPAERALAAWARLVARDPNATGPADVQALRAAGYDDVQIHAITLFVALRLAFSAVNDALGATPDDELLAELPAPVRTAVTFGRRRAGLD
jgi:alkylhydroperoxidase family enzyme